MSKESKPPETTAPKGETTTAPKGETTAPTAPKTEAAQQVVASVEFYALDLDGRMYELRESELGDFIDGHPGAKFFPPAAERQVVADQFHAERRMRVARAATARAKVERQRRAYAAAHPEVIANERVREAKARGVDLDRLLEAELRKRR